MQTARRLHNLLKQTERGGSVHETRSRLVLLFSALAVFFVRHIAVLRRAVLCVGAMGIHSLLCLAALLFGRIALFVFTVALFIQFFHPL